MVVPFLGTGQRLFLAVCRVVLIWQWPVTRCVPWTGQGTDLCRATFYLWHPSLWLSLLSQRAELHRGLGSAAVLWHGAGEAPASPPWHSTMQSCTCCKAGV